MINIYELSKIANKKFKQLYMDNAILKFWQNFNKNDGEVAITINIYDKETLLIELIKKFTSYFGIEVGNE